MAVFEHILIPYDGSSAARRAAEKAIDLAADQGAHLTALKVIDFLGELITPSDNLWATIEADVKEKASALLKELEDVARERGVSVSTRISEGPTEAEVATAAKDCRADLIVMGASGTSGVDLGHRLGKNIRRIVMEAPCPVMLVH
jgi:nucleotide-binding universal stress UspA family protein